MLPRWELRDLDGRRRDYRMATCSWLAALSRSPTLKHHTDHWRDLRPTHASVVTVAGMRDADIVHTAPLLRNGKVLVVGMDQSRPELYDPARNFWSGTGPSMGGHMDTSTLLRDGRLILVGGYGSESFDSVLVYDPNGSAPVVSGPLDPRLIAALSVGTLLRVTGFALSIPSLRRRLGAWDPRNQPDEWIT